MQSVEFTPQQVEARAQELTLLEARLPTIDGDFVGKSIVSMSQFERDDVERIFTEAHLARELDESDVFVDNLKGKRVARLFYEDSTRTDQSFRFAIGGAGGFIDGFTKKDLDGMSANKGETDEDTLETLDEYAHLLIVRHSDELFVPRAALSACHPVYNAGNGSRWHPTQAFLDGVTIKEKKGHLEGLRVTMQGDMLKGRTAHSLAEMLAMFGVELNFVAPEPLQMPQSVVVAVRKHGIEPLITDDIYEVIENTDVLYRMRTQIERFTKEELAKLPPLEMVTLELLEKAPDSISLMHPRPEDKNNPDFDPAVRKDFRYDVNFQTRMGWYARRGLAGLTLDRALGDHIGVY